MSKPSKPTSRVLCLASSANPSNTSHDVTFQEMVLYSQENLKKYYPIYQIIEINALLICSCLYLQVKRIKRGNLNCCVLW
jgi:hypothetical protein